ncbi:MAG: DUF1287 domain-containing protein [bacterium]|nr:DUF1287 domain-containing protein [bacterium]
MKRRFTKLILISLLALLCCRFSQAARVYSTAASLNVRDLPSTTAKIVERLRHGRWVEVLEKKEKWLKIRMPNGTKGYVSARLTSAVWLKILKAERHLDLMQDEKLLKRYPIGLGFNPLDDKIKLGDGCTPEGRFYICEVIRKPSDPAVYGPVAFRISYPGIEDARRGLQAKLITLAQYRAIVKAVNKGKIPPRRTPLGSSIKIHGGNGGAGSNWTLGCVALENADITEMSLMMPGQMTLVDIYRDMDSYRRLNDANYLNKQTLIKAAKLIKKGCKYTRKAINIIPLRFPMGDFNQSEGVCTDVAIRSLRGGQIDLQALLYEDILLHPHKYPQIRTPNTNIDHRRTRNLDIFFRRHTEVLTVKPPAQTPAMWLPGDIVTMDTGIQNGTVYDHIGIVSHRKNAEGIPLVINLWTVGDTLNEMELLNGDYPGIVGHYRLFHPFYYQ